MSQIATTHVGYETRDRTAWITLNRPEALNALSIGLLTDLNTAFAEASRDQDILTVVLSGAGGRAFSTGGDLKEMAAAQAAQVKTGNTRSDLGGWGAAATAGFNSVRKCEKPVIAAIGGYCLAGGFELTLTCDIRVATRDSVFGLPEARRSLLAGPGLTELPRMIPMAEALRIAMTGAPITAQRAYEIGLVQELADDYGDLTKIVEGIAAELAQCAPLAVRDIKRLMWSASELTVDQSQRLRNLLADHLARTEDALEGPRAFAEKRAPVWQHR